MIVIETKDAVLVANKDSSQNLKNAVSLMKNEGFNEAENHKLVYRPWVHFCLLKNLIIGKSKNSG